jgi:hypothetical protein
MTGDELKATERRLRDALQPQDEVVRRVVRRSLAAGEPGAGERPRRWPRLAIAGTALVAVALAVVLLVPHLLEPVGGGGEPDLPPPLITNASGEVRLLIAEPRPAWDRDHPADPVVLTNSNGLMMAVLPSCCPRYLIVGGES